MNIITQNSFIVSIKEKYKNAYCYHYNVVIYGKMYILERNICLSFKFYFVIFYDEE